MSKKGCNPPKKKMSKAAFREHCYGLAFVAPPFIGFLVFMAFPIVFAFIASLTTWNGMNNMMDHFCGFENYIKLFSDEKFWKVLGHTIIYMIGIPIGMFLGIFIAMGKKKKGYIYDDDIIKYGTIKMHSAYFVTIIIL